MSCKDPDAISLEFEMEEDTDETGDDYNLEEILLKKKQKPKQRRKKTNAQSTNKECICKVCNRKLKTTSCLTTHMRTHTGERYVVDFATFLLSLLYLSMKILSGFVSKSYHSCVRLLKLV